MVSSDKLKKIALSVLDFLFDLIIIFLVVWLLRTYFISPFKVSGTSMLDTLYDGDFLIVNKFEYLMHSPNRGDVVVIKPPQDADKFYVKRLIGLPGDTLEFRNGDVYVVNKEYPQGLLLREPYLNAYNLHNTFLYGNNRQGTITIPEDKYFVMGDNRTHSTDSRAWAYSNMVESGAIPRENIIGYVWIVMFPNSRIVEHARYDNAVIGSGVTLNIQ